MWEWRDETARGQWRLDGSGSWIWDEPSLLERVGLGPASFGPGSASSGAPWAPPEPWSPPRAGRGPWTDVPDVPSWSDPEPRTDSWELDALSEETPIFEAVAEDQERDDAGDRRRRHGALEDDDGHPGAADRVEYRTAPWIPEPSPGSGPFPAQGRSGQGRSGPRRAAWVPPERADGRGPDPDVPARHARSPYDDAEGHDAEGHEADGYGVEDDHVTGHDEDARERVGGRHTLRR